MRGQQRILTSRLSSAEAHPAAGLCRHCAAGRCAGSGRRLPPVSEVRQEQPLGTLTLEPAGRRGTRRLSTQMMLSAVSCGIRRRGSLHLDLSACCSVTTMISCSRQAFPPTSPPPADTGVGATRTDAALRETPQPRGRKQGNFRRQPPFSCAGGHAGRRHGRHAPLRLLQLVLEAKEAGGPMLAPGVRPLGPCLAHKSLPHAPPRNPQSPSAAVLSFSLVSPHALVPEGPQHSRRANSVPKGAMVGGSQIVAKPASHAHSSRGTHGANHGTIETALPESPPPSHLPCLAATPVASVQRAGPAIPASAPAPLPRPAASDTAAAADCFPHECR